MGELISIQSHKDTLGECECGSNTFYVHLYEPERGLVAIKFIECAECAGMVEINLVSCDNA